MLNLNPGLREITYSITGGSIMAQGYWMPYSCARAVCATFCYHIAGALIPIFGPDFPSDCLPPQSSDFARMVIDPILVAEAARETELMRQDVIRAIEDGATTSSFHQSRIRQPHGGSQGTYQQPDIHSRPSSMHRRILPPPESLYVRHIADALEDGRPQLAPINYSAPQHDDLLLPSPVEHGRLPPLTRMPVPSSVTLPNLFRRDAHTRNRHGHVRNSHNYTTDHTHQREHQSLPSLRTGYECDIPNSTEELSRHTQPRRPHLDSPPSPRLISSDQQVRWRPKVEETQSSVPRVGSALQATLSNPGFEHRRGVADNGHQDGHFAPSYCYPSPPRRQHAHLRHSSEDEKKPHSGPVHVVVKDEVKYATALETDKKPIGPADNQGHDVHYHPLQKTPTKRRKAKVSGGVAGPSSSSSSWNATDVDAAEVLVNFSVKMQAPDTFNDGRRPDTKKPKNDPRLIASIASLLCDDEVPCNKRRKS
ncbi:uncharacterized protein SPSK_09156 [Sporothrix schenckii 1099-18]|uniref:HTH APSES-type domain-containing protein n=1 Tax=Sporothrix schenckii 1099-18 TaxID=1397361 RepID=A0A0F2M811_SPOSC|nr:uncharacterized protein SPSK_09156 [Sporothrix schenckii 1099-18]KJR85833.1 hypothetical protein SPSK_09156 [Sporothrix schenckii 1099-18]